MWEFASAYFSETAKMSVPVCLLLKCMLFLLGINRDTGKEVIGLNKRGEEKGRAEESSHLQLKHDRINKARSQIWMHTLETILVMGGSEHIFGGSKITANGECSHEIQRHLLLGRKAMKNLDSILNSRNMTLPTKVHLVMATVFPVVMYGC